MTNTPSFRYSLSLVAATLLFTAITVQAGPSGATVDAQARYREDMAFCNSGQSSQDTNTCRLEARNALAEAKRGGLSDAPGQYARNAVERCNQFQGDERAACEARIFGPARVEGSVEGGGVLRESVIVTPVK